MATTTATLTINSTDLLTDEISLSTTSTLTGAGNSTGLTGTTGLARKTLASGHAQYTLFDGSDFTADKAHKLFLKNTSTTATEYFLIFNIYNLFYASVKRSVSSWNKAYSIGISPVDAVQLVAAISILAEVSV